PGNGRDLAGQHEVDVVAHQDVAVARDVVALDTLVEEVVEALAVVIAVEDPPAVVAARGDVVEEAGRGSWAGRAGRGCFRPHWCHGCGWPAARGRSRAARGSSCNAGAVSV